MVPVRFVAVLLFVLWPGASTLLADGGFILPQGAAADLAQTRQEVVLAIHDDPADGGSRVTYVLGTSYTGQPAEFAWVIPLPAIPTDVIAHETDSLFGLLNDMTQPRFWVTEPGPAQTDSGLGCFACVPTAGTLGREGALVEVEARGQAGIFEWVALTSTGSNALLTWLNQNGFNVPATAADVLNGYIQLGMHFLALRVNEPSQNQGSQDGEIEIPPVQFTCQTSQRFYPMAISQISAADETEVVVYVLGEHRAEAANLPNGLIDPEALRYDAASPSLSNYESLFTQTIAGLGGVALITEYVGRVWTDDLSAPSFWPEAPAGLPLEMFLTRLRTVIPRDRMTLDFEFQDAPDDQTISRQFWIEAAAGANAGAAAGLPLAMLLLCGLFLMAAKRRVAWGC